jgi:glutamate-ammonia-ligase adenylyltransferase
MNTRMSSGILYEIDMRLRPSGASGMLVSSIAAFERYQEKDAWTWEHQALVRARFIHGDQLLKTQFETVRANIMCRHRDKSILATEVAEMRQKMRDHLEPSECKAEESSYFHLKHSQGGIVDIEFMVQYAVLAWSEQYPNLLRYTDNIRILEQMADSGLITAEESEMIGDAYRSLRTQGHVLALQGKSSTLEAEPYRELRHHVTSMWQKILNS